VSRARKCDAVEIAEKLIRRVAKKKKRKSVDDDVSTPRRLSSIAFSSAHARER